VVVDPKKERNAVRESRKLDITTVALIDTDCDPDDVDLPIPGNDDGIRSIEAIVKHLADAVLRGKATVAAQSEGTDDSSGQVVEEVAQAEMATAE
jgi:small subunit ribosomal protein S2